VKDENQSFKWDGQKRRVEAWDRDQTFRSALKYSVVWVYQEIARQVGERREAEFLKKFGYGNEDVSGRVDHFWLDGQLRITALQTDRVSEEVLPQPAAGQRTQQLDRERYADQRSKLQIHPSRQERFGRFSDPRDWMVGWLGRDRQ
jgi:beta-lactamase class D OXA-48